MLSADAHQGMNLPFLLSAFRFLIYYPVHDSKKLVYLQTHRAAASDAH
jgi:hypothetical protein